MFVLTQLQPAATRFSFPNHELTSRKSSAVVIDDEQALDPAWLSFTTTSKPDKAAIKEALKAGQQITGAQLLSRRSIHQRCPHQQPPRSSSTQPEASIGPGADPLL